MGKVIRLRPPVSADWPDELIAELNKEAEKEICTAPEGKYRIVGFGGGTYESFVVDDFNTKFRALSIARNLSRQSKGIKYSVFDDSGKYLDPPSTTF